MIGAFVSATVDIGDVEDGLSAMERRSKQLGPTFQSLKAPMRDDQKEHAKQKVGPDSSWPPRLPSTIASHKKLPRKLLGRLPTAVSYKATGYSVTAESLVKWSLAHQEGGTVGRGARLPARPFLWISDKLLEVAAEALTKALAAAFGGE